MENNPLTFGQYQESKRAARCNDLSNPHKHDARHAEWPAWMAKKVPSAAVDNQYKYFIQRKGGRVDALTRTDAVKNEQIDTSTKKGI